MAQIISVDKIEDGMILAEPIVNNFGQTLIPSGATLQLKHQKLLKTWNIRSLYIKGDGSEEEIEIGEISDELRILATERLKKRLKWKPQNEIEKDLLQIGIMYSAKLIVQKK